MLGFNLMPHQKHILDVMLEVKSDGTPVYREGVVLMPRQCAKTTTTLILELHRAILWGGPQVIGYTAQTGWDARRKLIDDQVPLIESSPLAKSIKRVYRGAGMESIKFLNGSRIDVMPSTPTAGHGRTIDLAILDEAMSDEDDRREQAILPAMATRREAQLFVISTAGTQSSLYLKRKVDQGRAIVEANIDAGVAYFEWSADQDDDIDDPRVWAENIPAMNYTIDESSIRHARATMSEGEFRRAYLCQWTHLEESVIPDKLIHRVLDPTTVPAGKLYFGIDVSMDRSFSSISVADETGRVELIEHRPGVSWVVDRAVQLHRQYKGTLIVDGYSPANSLVDRLEAGGIPIVRYSLRDMVSACGVLYDAILDDAIRIRPHPMLELALKSARKKMIASGWLWSRTIEEADLTPLFSATMAYYHATNRQTPDTKRSAIF
jgi:phage terminase large subunit-like protein